MALDVSDRILHLRAAGVSLVLDARGPRLPRVLHWGADPGELSEDDLAALAASAALPQLDGSLDVPPPPGLVTEHGAGWQGMPGVAGHRAGGADWSPLFAVTSATDATRDGDGGGRTLRFTAADPAAALSLAVDIGLTATGLVRTRATLTNDHADADWTLDTLAPSLPVPTEAAELFDLTGRWSRERVPQRQPFTLGARVRETRRGRPGHDAPLLFAAGTPGFGFGHGEVWALHLAWSGNHRLVAERLPTGQAVLSGGELPMPGEITLTPGASYTTPWLYGAHSDHGLDALSARFHDHLRARPHHPATPRPVVLNTWEAVYFDHDLPTLTRLADLGAAAGAERFVLDDGWFRHRRADTAGLGDWYVDETVWPDGLHPLVDHVRGLGMEFGLWVEPEMVNPDSDLARAHPEWILATGGRLPGERRQQQVLDLSHPEAYAYVLERLDALLGAYDIAYLKWDHNRELDDAGHSPHGEPAVHAQTLAVYALLAELRRRHPALEIESCCGGGGRIDLGILEHTDRVWASDCIDALERQAINRWTQLLLPPELIGSHVGSDRNHTTGRRHDIAFRAGTAFLGGHFGIEWDLIHATDEERAEAARWVAHYKRHRTLLHTGRVIRIDHQDPALWAHGVVARDGSEALFALVGTAAPVTHPHGRVRLRGLDPHARYRADLLPPGRDLLAGARSLPGWLDGATSVLHGGVLATTGLQIPALQPEQLVVLHLTKE
ncbi:alpha-galactosidase [Streptomyces sp. MS19]|uniref:alpha-galactosidase n=1 Tax=Streptomyces sp. MS19 TaxID=3385972 RepID=UPI0039A19569